MSVSLSGGGHRSTLVSLGVLLAIVDVSWNELVRSITSVSGGSLANAFVWARCDFKRATPDEFGFLVREAMSAVRRGAVFGTGRAKLRVLAWLAALTIVAAMTVAWFTARSQRPTAESLLVVAAALFSVAGLVRMRGWILERNINELWFSESAGRKTRFSGTPGARTLPLTDFPAAFVDRDQPTLHLIASTDLVSGEPVYFTQGAVIADFMAWPLTSIPLSRAVRASLSVPGVLPPVRLALSRLVHRGAEIARTRDRRLLLADGGIFNNLGTDWDHTYRDTVRAADYLVLHPSHEVAAATRIVVDASARTQLGPSPISRLPILGSIHNVVRAIRVTFRAGLYGRQLTDVHQADPTRIAIQAGHVDARPFWRLPDEMHLTRGVWAYVADRVRRTPTTLRSLTNNDCVFLVAHGYREATAALYDCGAIQGGESSWGKWLAAALFDALPKAVLAEPAVLPTKLHGDA